MKLRSAFWFRLEINIVKQKLFASLKFYFEWILQTENACKILHRLTFTNEIHLLWFIAIAGFQIGVRLTENYPILNVRWNISHAFTNLEVENVASLFLFLVQ